MTKTEKELQRLSEALGTLVERTYSNKSDVTAVMDFAEKLEKIIEKIREQNTSLQTQLAVLQANFADLTKRWDESDRRRWTVYGVLLAASLTFVANLVLLFLKR
jgi:predicted  nucleic acid-binding Zn-ribbon protein